jgi:hypothetical protein
MSIRKTVSALGPILIGALALCVGLAKPQRAQADGAAEAAEKNERCATRLSIALLGKTAAPELVTAPNPQDAVDGMLVDAAFIERFARFANSQFNPEPGEAVGDDASYTLAKFVLGDAKTPWKEMFVGAYEVTDTVTAKADGLGYFRSAAWMKRYEGNELAGYRIASAYRIMQNTTGLTLTATTNAEGVDISAEGRKNGSCKGCHYDGWFALDLVAKTLSKRNLRTGAGQPPYIAPTEGPQTILGGKTIANDKELVEALVASENFKFNACRLSFQFLYGRKESTCEGTVFDKCIDAFNASGGTIQSAIAAIAKDPTFCQ